MSPSLLQPFSLTGKGILTIKPRLPITDHLPLVIDLKGIFNRMIAKKLKKRIITFLNENRGSLAINFSGITITERDALLVILKRLRGKKERIKIISINSLRADITDAITYAKTYFEVFNTVEDFHTNLA
jgi:uncharacterized protein (UPF0261 family)